MLSVPVPNEDYSNLIDTLGTRGINTVFVASKDDLSGINNNPRFALIESRLLTDRELVHCLNRCAELNLASLVVADNANLEIIDPALPITELIVAPFVYDELFLRVMKIISSTQPMEDPNIICVGDLVINMVNFEVTIRGRRISLRYKEYELLLLMARNPGRVFSREVLLNQIWGYEYLGGTRTVDVHIRRLRSKIEEAGDTFIETVWQVGYRFKSLN